MRRLLLLVLAVLLPLQFAWGAVTGYCQHETGVAASHFAHHEHVHKADPAKAAESKFAQDADCGICHAGGAPAVATALPAPSVVLALNQPALAHSPDALASAPTRAPERPQWPRLAWSAGR
jgi:hypothetical protein